MTEVIVIKTPSPELIKFLDEKREKQKEIIEKYRKKLTKEDAARPI